MGKSKNNSFKDLLGDDELVSTTQPKLSNKQLKKLKREELKKQQDFTGLSQLYNLTEVWLLILEFLPVSDLLINCASLNQFHFNLIHSANCYACEEFYKMISLILLASEAGSRFYHCGIVCSNRFAYCISMSDGIGIAKYNLTSMDDFSKFFIHVTQFLSSFCIDKFCEAKRNQLFHEERSINTNENKENDTKMNNVKGIEKQKKSKNKLSLEKRRIISNITN